MIPVFRTLTAALAILATVLTAGVVGAARGQAAAVGEMVLCSGGVAVSVPVDADGRPTGPPHWCPDCVASLFAAAVDPPALTPSPVVTGAVIIATFGTAPVLPCPHRTQQARGPPSPV